MLLSGAHRLPFIEDAGDRIDGSDQMMSYSISYKQWLKKLLANVEGMELQSNACRACIAL